MSFRSRFVFFAIWFASIVATAGVWGYAQAPQVVPPLFPQPGAPASTTIISGADLGFRVDRMDGQTPVGAFVVRKDGQWVEVRESVGPRRVTSR